MASYVPTGVTVYYGSIPITATSVSVTRPSAEVVDVTGVSDTIGTRALVVSGDKVGQATIQVNGFLQSGSTFATGIGAIDTLTISGSTIPTISSSSAVLVAVDEPIQQGQLRTVSLTFLVESI
jgi:hypothetical protein